MRSQRRREAALQVLEKEGWQSPAPSNPEAGLFLENAWRELSPELATIGIYYFVDGLNHAQIAALLKISRRTVGNRIEALRAQVRVAAGEHKS